MRWVVPGLMCLVAWMAWTWTRASGVELPAAEVEAAMRRPDGEARVTEVSDRGTPMPRVPAKVAPTAPAAPLAVILCDAADDRPLVDVRLVLWTYGNEENRSQELVADAQGVRAIPAQALDGVTGCDFEVTLPEFSESMVITPRPRTEEILRSTGPYRLHVARGRVRELRVVDGRGAPIEGAEVSADLLRTVASDGRGIARPCMTEPPQKHVTVVAPGHRQVFVEVPPPDVEWVVVLPLANRLEIALRSARGAVDAQGFHATIALGASFVQRSFWQSHYEQTPGRGADGTPAHWSVVDRRRSAWECGFLGDGRAVLDQFDDAGDVDITLRRFDEIVAVRQVTLPIEGGRTRVVFDVDGATTAELALRVVDAEGAPIGGAVLRSGAPLGARLSPTLDDGFPVWAPRRCTASDGRCTMPVPQRGDAALVVAAPGFAVRVITVDELRRDGGILCLSPARAIEIEIRDRDGAILSEGPTTGYTDHVRPIVALGAGLWLTSPSNTTGPEFRLEALPPGVVEIRFDRLPDGAVLRHDTAQPRARFVAAESVDELQLGK